MVNFAFIGCGFIAQKHADAIAQIPTAKLYAVCDKVAENMKPYEEQYNALPFSEYDQMLEDNNVHVVNICTPSGTHAALAIKAARAGKHVILEKPMALSGEDAKAIVQACDENKVKLAVIHPNRFRPALMELKKLMEEGKFGKISHANATVRWNRNQAYYDQAAWRGTKAMDGGVLMNQAIHNLDLLLWLMGPAAELQAYTATRFRNIECEDVAVAVVNFESGALGVIEAATTIYPKNLEESISIFGEKGTAIIRGAQANRFEHLAIEGYSAEELEAIKKIGEQQQEKSGHLWIIEDMIESIKYNKEPVISGTDGYHAVQLVLAISEAAENKKPVKLNP